MKHQLGQFTKDFFEGLGWRTEANPNGRIFSYWKDANEKWADRFVDVSSAQQIALEVMIRVKRAQLETAFAENDGDTAQGLNLELDELEKLREELRA